mgnify:CR=1 FL=1
MMQLWNIVLSVLPFDWVRYDFMKTALLAVMLVSPSFGLIGTMIVGNRMAFFSDVIGHSALTGLAIGILLGFADPRPVMVVFAILLAVAIQLFRRVTSAAADTVIGVFFAATIALGVALLSRGGNFSKFTVFLVGDILGVTPGETVYLALMLLIIVFFWIVAGNSITLVGINPSLARSRGIRVFLIETMFSALVAAVVILSIRWVGILIINSLFILPAASSRLVAGSVRRYTVLSVLLSLVAGIAGLIISFYWGTACGATIVLCAAVLYLCMVMVKGAGFLKEKKMIRFIFKE